MKSALVLHDAGFVCGYQVDYAGQIAQGLTFCSLRNLYGQAVCRILCTVMALTPVSAAICLMDSPRCRSPRTHSRRTAALGWPCARRPAWTRSDSRMRSCLHCFTGLRSSGVFSATPHNEERQQRDDQRVQKESHPKRHGSSMGESGKSTKAPIRYEGISRMPTGDG